MFSLYGGHLLAQLVGNGYTAGYSNTPRAERILFVNIDIFLISLVIGSYCLNIIPNWILCMMIVFTAVQYIRHKIRDNALVHQYYAILERNGQEKWWNNPRVIKICQELFLGEIRNEGLTNACLLRLTTSPSSLKKVDTWF